jgi:hypothetical protein
MVNLDMNTNSETTPEQEGKRLVRIASVKYDNVYDEFYIVIAVYDNEKWINNEYGPSFKDKEEAETYRDFYNKAEGKAKIYFDGEAFRAKCPNGRYVDNLGICDSCPQKCFGKNKEELIEKARQDFYGR